MKTERKGNFWAGVCAGVLATVLLGAVAYWVFHPAPEKSGTAQSGSSKRDFSRPASRDSELPAQADSRVPRPGDKADARTPDQAFASENGSETSEAGAFFVDPLVLRAKFPDNLALPPADRESFERKKAARAERNRMYGRITAGKATAEEINTFYSQQERLALDSIELLEFVLKTYRDEMSERDVKKHEFMLQQFKRRLAAIPEKEFEALARLESKQQDG